MSWFSTWLHCRRHPQASPETLEALARQTNLLARDGIVAAAERRRAGRLAAERESNNFAKRLELHFRGEL